MTSFAQAHVQAKPFALICSFETPTTELDPDLVSSVSVCVGDYLTLDDAKRSFAAIENHPALISAWGHQSLRAEDYQ